LKQKKTDNFISRTAVNHIICFNYARLGLEKGKFYYKDSSDFVKYLRNNESRDQRIWFSRREASFNDRRDPEFVETIVRHGIGFTFNMVDADQWLNFDK
jgi:hypothetical protein